MSQVRYEDLLVDIGVVVFSCAMFYLSYLVLVAGAIPTRFANGYHTFEGFERVLGLFPLFLGSLFQYLILVKVKCRIFDKEKFEKEYMSSKN
jgi:hypothetical protein